MPLSLSPSLSRRIEPGQRCLSLCGCSREKGEALLLLIALQFAEGKKSERRSSLSFFLPIATLVSPSFARAHHSPTHPHPRTHIHTHTHTHARTHTPYLRSDPRFSSITSVRFGPCWSTFFSLLPPPTAHTHTHTHTYTHTYADFHTHTSSSSLSLPLASFPSFSPPLSPLPPPPFLQTQTKSAS